MLKVRKKERETKERKTEGRNVILNLGIRKCNLKCKIIFVGVLDFVINILAAVQKLI